MARRQITADFVVRKPAPETVTKADLKELILKHAPEAYLSLGEQFYLEQRAKSLNSLTFDWDTIGRRTRWT